MSKTTIDMAHASDWENRVEENLKAGVPVEIRHVRTRHSFAWCFAAARKYGMAVSLGLGGTVLFEQLPK